MGGTIDSPRDYYFGNQIDDNSAPCHLAKSAPSLDSQAELGMKHQTFACRVNNTGHPRKIILFGSYVTGDMNADSDLDILVIGDNSIDNSRKRVCVSAEP